jgi:2',3'-cyclic-nucleotide 2'-phosphodiesterase / 3'-nucleotidase
LNINIIAILKMNLLRLPKTGLLFFLLLVTVSCSRHPEGTLYIAGTTDLHGYIFPFDFIENEELDASLAHAASYIREIRDKGENIILLDNGDNLQGQPTVYYYNFIDTLSPHMMAEALNFMDYDAATAGNHDIEAGHSVYDRLVKEYNFPLLAANAVDVKTGKPYFQPFTIINKNGIRVAVLGLVTPSIPEWLPPRLYSGMEFLEMEETARKWMPAILKEKPDLVVGLFHSGWNREEFMENRERFLTEDGSAAVAYNVPGFDIIFNGHDHRLANEKFVNAVGDTVLMLNAGSRARNISLAEITFSGKKKTIKGQLIDVTKYDPEKEFSGRFKEQYEDINDYVSREIGRSETTLSSRDSYFGPSAFVDMIHAVQLDVTGAELSFTAPLSFDVKIPAGPIRVGDLFKLYRYENMLYTIQLSGEEIRNYLEFSYGGWFNTMKAPGDLMLRLRTGKDGRPVMTNGQAWLQNQAYNFDSAAGIDYTVDVSKPEGSRIAILGFSNGSPFDEKKMYRVAVNSYRGSGGGGHLTDGAGLSREEINARLISSTDRDLRFFILKYIESKKVINQSSFGNWKIIPEEWSRNASRREYGLLFGERTPGS